MDGITAPPVFSAHDLVAFTPPGSPRTYRLAPLTYRERIAFRTALAREAGMRPSPQDVSNGLRTALREIAPTNLDEALAVVDDADASSAVIDLDVLAVRLGDHEVRLTAREASLLAFLAERRHRAVPRDELLVEVWGYRDGSIQTRTVDVHIQQLRAKLKSVGGESWVGTIRGRGYRFVGTEDVG